MFDEYLMVAVLSLAVMFGIILCVWKDSWVFDVVELQGLFACTGLTTLCYIQTIFMIKSYEKYREVKEPERKLSMGSQKSMQANHPKVHDFEVR